MRPAKLVLLSSIALEPCDKSEMFTERNIIAKRLKDISEKFRIVLIIDIARNCPSRKGQVWKVYWPGGLHALEFADRVILRTEGFEETVLKNRGKV